MNSGPSGQRHRHIILPTYLPVNITLILTAPTKKGHRPDDDGPHLTPSNLPNLPKT